MPKKDTVCLECGEEKSFTDLSKHRKKDAEAADNYCKEHLSSYHTHTKCEPEWCPKCGTLEKYLITL